MPRSDCREALAIREVTSLAAVFSDVRHSAVAECGEARVMGKLLGPSQLVAEHRADRGKVYARITRLGALPHRPSPTDDWDTALSLSLEGVLDEVICTETFPQLAFELQLLVSTPRRLDVVCEALDVMRAVVETVNVMLSEASVPMESLLGACGAVLTGDGQALLDPTCQEIANARTYCLVLGTQDRVLFTRCGGSRLDGAGLEHVTRLATAGVRAAIRSSKSKLLRLLETT